MRYDRKILFVKEGESTYDYDTGNYIPGPSVETERWANVTGQTIERMQLHYGHINEKALTIRLQNIYEEPFDHIELDSRTYQVDSQKKFRRDHVLYVSEQP